MNYKWTLFLSLFYLVECTNEVKEEASWKTMILDKKWFLNESNSDFIELCQNTKPRSEDDMDPRICREINKMILNINKYIEKITTTEKERISNEIITLFQNNNVCSYFSNSVNDGKLMISDDVLLQALNDSVSCQAVCKHVITHLPKNLCYELALGNMITVFKDINHEGVKVNESLSNMIKSTDNVSKGKTNESVVEENKIKKPDKTEASSMTGEKLPNLETKNEQIGGKNSEPKPKENVQIPVANSTKNDEKAAQNKDNVKDDGEDLDANLEKPEENPVIGDDTLMNPKDTDPIEDINGNTEEEKRPSSNNDEDIGLDEGEPVLSPDIGDENSVTLKSNTGSSHVNNDSHDIEIVKDDESVSDKHMYSIGKSEDADDPHFVIYFFTIASFIIVGYIAFHNKYKFLAYILEGKKSKNNRRRPNSSNYRKLDTNLEEVITSNTSGSSVTHVIY